MVHGMKYAAKSYTFSAFFWVLLMFPKLYLAHRCRTCELAFVCVLTCGRI